MTKNNNPFLLLSILLSLLCLSHSQITTKTLAPTCLCDTSDACDFECCCDQECEQSLKDQLNAYGKCADDGFGIPYCAGLNETDINPRDLYSGLNTIYKIIKRLFCIERVNNVNPASYYSSTFTDLKVETIVDEQEEKKKAFSIVPNDIKSLSTATITGLFYASPVSTCYQSNKITSKMSTGSQKCLAFLSEMTGIGTNVFLSTQKIAENFPDLKIYSMEEPSQTTPTAKDAASSPTSCTGGVCSNVIRYIKLYITQSNTMSSLYSYAVIGTVNDVEDGGHIEVMYDYEYLSSDASFQKSANIGYEIGSSLVIVNKVGSQYYRVANPINLAYRNPDGTCRTATTDASDSSLVELVFGRNQFYTCYGETTSLIYENLKNSFNYVGTTGSSGKTINDYVVVEWPTISSTRSVVVKFYYVKVGAEKNPQYYIINVQATERTTINSQQTLYLEYEQIENSPQMYIPAPPRVHAYLPNDFLYPFYVAE